MDSRIATYEHIQVVQSLLDKAIINLITRRNNHDQSKLKSPEKEIFDQYTPRLKSMEYGSLEYKECLKEMQVGLDHHYKNNDHHPEYYNNGIEDMSLLSLLEMIIDWKAASMRHENGDILNSININQERFKYPDIMKKILINTINELGLQQK